MTPEAAIAQAIERGVAFLERAQATAGAEARQPGRIFCGDWPQRFGVRVGPIVASIRDTTPFVAAFVLENLRFVTAENQAALGVSALAIRGAGLIRARMARLFPKFVHSDGSYGWWPPGADPPRGLARIVSRIILAVLSGPRFHGSLVPHGTRFFPEELRLWPDADDTAVVYLALRRQAMDGSGVPPSNPWHELLARWRDTPEWERSFPPELRKHSGVFLTWFIEPRRRCLPNNVDAVVLCNVLHSLAHWNRLDTPGVSESIRWLDEIVRRKLHVPIGAISVFYGSNWAFHYALSRCAHEAPIRELLPTASLLADEVESGAVRPGNGEVCWRGAGPRPTAYALLTLLNTGRTGLLADGAAAWLAAKQHAKSGAWRDPWAPVGATSRGMPLLHRSDAACTGLAVEALCRHLLARRQGS